MKQYDTFGEYMFDLLFAPLKKGKRAANQFFIFFKVIGRVFDGLKKDALRVRDETNIATASSVMLPIHGQDRNMSRLAGESVEGYRTRLAMKGIIAEKGGLKDGILYALAALGYEQSTIEPIALQAPERWAEFIVFLGRGNSYAVRELFTIYQEIQRVKEGSSKLAYFVCNGNEPFDVPLKMGIVTSSYTELELNSADSIVLVKDRVFTVSLSIRSQITSYSEIVLESPPL